MLNSKAMLRITYNNVLTRVLMVWSNHELSKSRDKVYQANSSLTYDLVSHSEGLIVLGGAVEPMVDLYIHRARQPNII